MVADISPLAPPKTDQIAIDARLVGGFETISERLSKLQMYSMLAKDAGIELLMVEARDLQKKPSLFFIITIGKAQVKVDYTIGEDSNEKLRRLYVLKNLMSVLALITDIYVVDATELLQYVDSAIDSFIVSMPQNYSELYNKYDSLATHYRELKREANDLESSNKSLTASASLLQTENDEFRKRLKVLETYSDESLMVMIQEWIDAHGGAIDITAFAETYKIIPTRVEQALNKMVSAGYIEIKG